MTEPTARPRITLIAAMARNRAIGLDQRLPWRLPADLKRFKALTTGHAIVMGRKTYDSIGRPLPWRSTVVITRQPDYAPPGVLVAHSLDEALERAREAGEAEEIFVAGGEEIFRLALALGRGDRIQLTYIDQDFPGDTFFPGFDEAAWRLVEREDHPATDSTPFGFSFLVYDRIPVKT
ncbi:MAG TPA: dihydrofolate reductase [Thermoanaerobaculia bacterium]|jgi:dihydrofolate reductase